MRAWIVVFVASALALAVGCGGKKAAGNGKPKIAVSIFPLYDVTRRIAGDRANVVLVLPPGKSEHGYDPTPKEIARLEGARLGIAVGLDMDGWVENIIRTAGGDAKIVRVGTKVETIPIGLEPIGEDEHHGEHGEHHDDHDTPAAGSAAGSPAGSASKHDDHDDHDKPAAGSVAGSAAGSAAEHDDHDDHDDHDKPDEHGHAHAAKGAPDPHVWMHPNRMQTIATVIRDELIALDPEGGDTYLKNHQAFMDSLVATDRAIEARSKTWTKRIIVTFHGSMGYFAKRYGLHIAAVVEPIAGKEPTAAYIAEVLAAIKKTHAAALFTEPQLARGPGETIAREAGIPLGELDPVGGVSGRDSYELLLTWNADQLDKALK